MNGADITIRQFLLGNLLPVTLGNIVGGAVCVSDEGLAQELRSDRTALGSTPGSLEVWLLQRSLRTLHLRVKQQSESAAALAECRASWNGRGRGRRVGTSRVE